MDQSFDWSIDPLDPSVDPPINLYIERYRWLDGSIDGSIDDWWIYRWIHWWISPLIDTPMDQWMVLSVNWQIDGFDWFIDGSIDGSLHWWIYRWILSSMDLLMVMDWSFNGFIDGSIYGDKSINGTLHWLWLMKRIIWWIFPLMNQSIDLPRFTPLSIVWVSGWCTGVYLPYELGLQHCIVRI